MAHSYSYSVLRVVPDARRGECVNIGIAVFLPDRTDIRVLQSLSKVSVLNAQIDLAQLRDLPQVAAEWLGDVDGVERRHELLKQLGIVTVTGLGRFEIQSLAEYESAVERLMKTLVTPVLGPRVAPANRRIATTLKTRFSERQILGRDVSDIAKHLVVPNYPIDADEGLFADFVLKNGAFHVTETADLRAASASNTDRLRIASLTAIKLHKATEKLGADTKRFVVYAARRDTPTAPPVNLLGDYSDEIFDIDSKKDMARYMDLIMQAASHTRSVFG